MNRIAQKLIDIMDIEVEYHDGVNEYGDGVISLNNADGTTLDRGLKKALGRPTFQNSSLYHELGHAIADFYDINNYEETEELFGDFEEDYEGLSALIASSLLTDKEDFISKYAQTHPEEDWADTVAYVIANYSSIKGKGKTLVEKKKVYVKWWIKEILKEG